MCTAPSAADLSDPSQEATPVEFRPLSADDTEDGTPMKMESLCMACQENVRPVHRYNIGAVDCKP